MSLEQISLLTGIGVAIGSLLIFVIKVTLQVSKSMDSNTYAINQINDTIMRLSVNHDHIAGNVQDHGVRLTKVETRLDYHEESHDQTR